MPSIAAPSHPGADGKSTRCRWSRPISDTTICPRARWSGKTVSSTKLWRSRVIPVVLVHPRRRRKPRIVPFHPQRRKDETTSRTSSDRQMGNERPVRELLHRPFDAGRAVPHARVLLGAGKNTDLQIDSASQTDEPSLTWALPQILSDAGIKYFTNGSDPIRGAFNPIGHLNFHSPFYWEGPTGSKVLMWSGISYTAVDDMTWGGWSPDQRERDTYSTSCLALPGRCRFFFRNTSAMTSL